MPTYPRGTILQHRDGSRSTADGTTDYDSSRWTVVSSTGPAQPSPTQNASLTPAEKIAKSPSLISNLQQQIKSGSISLKDALNQAAGTLGIHETETGALKNALFGNLGTFNYGGRIGYVDVNSVGFIPTETGIRQSVTGAGGTTVNTYSSVPRAAPAIFRNLEPGSSGEDVKQLQNWLVLQGYMSQADMNTGPGTYGNKTKAAVTAWQSANGIDVKGNPGYFGPISRNFVANQARATGGGGLPVDITAPVIGAGYQSDPSYSGLSVEEQELVDLSYNLISLGGESEAALFSKAIEQARAVADPYFRSLIELTKAEIAGSIAEANFDYETKAKIAQFTRDRLLEDVRSGKEYLTLEQQADLARAANEYDRDLLDISETAEAKGLTFATGVKSRVGAETRRTEDYADVVQSSGRQYNYNIRQLELKKSRGEVDAALELDRLRGSRALSLESIGRTAEQVLGSGNLPRVDGFRPVGNVMGQIEEDKRKSIIADTGAFYQLGQGFNFNY